jgi:pimeloyl-ACP methyl ester carboxylesterase
MATRPVIAMALVAAAVGGCGQPAAGPRVIFLDGAGWYGSERPVRSGLREAGFAGTVERFGWSSLLGPVHDHVTASADHHKVPALVRRIVAVRRAAPGDRLVLMGLSAGTSLIVSALERLPEGMAVDSVVLLSPSISSRRDLTAALGHVTGRLYATHSPRDRLLAGAPSAGLEAGPPAGQVGLRIPPDAEPPTRDLYRKVINLPWRPGYVAYGWDGGHISVTAAPFIRAVIAPRILDDRPHPLDRPPVVPEVARRD